MKSFRTSPSSSAAVPRAVPYVASLFDRHHLWLGAGALVAFLASVLTTMTLVERRDAPRARSVWVTTDHHTARWVSNDHRTMRWVSEDLHTARWVSDSVVVVVHPGPRSFRW